MFVIVLGENITVYNVQSRSQAEKVVFVKYVLSRSIEEVLSEVNLKFPQASGSGTYKNFQSVFYVYQKDKIHHPEHFRDWLLFDSDKLFCAYCLCFSSSNLKAISLLCTGIDSKQPIHQINQCIRRHEASKFHEISKNEYSKAACDDVAKNENFTENVKETRNVVKMILKIIIFIITHSKYIK